MIELDEEQVTELLQNISEEMSNLGSLYTTLRTHVGDIARTVAGIDARLRRLEDAVSALRPQR